MAVDELKNISKGIRELVTTTKAEFDKLAGKIGGEIEGVMSDEMTMVSGHLKSGFESFKNGASKMAGLLGAGFEDGKIFALAGFKLQKKETDTSVKSLKLDQTVAKHTLGYQRSDKRREEELLGLARKRTRWDKLRLFYAKYSFKKGLAFMGKKAVSGLFWMLFGIPLMILGTAIGVLLGRILSPFKVLANTKIGKYVASIWKFFSNLIKGTRVFRKLNVFLKRGPFKHLVKFFGWIMKNKFLGGAFLRGFKFGFTKLFWPLQIILSTIDFIKGFMNTEGTIYEKVKGGVENVIMKFLEFPIKLLGGLWEWFQVNIMGKDPGSIKKGEAAKTMLDGLSKYIKMAFTGWELIIGGMLDGAKWLWEEVIDKIDWKALKDKMISWGQNISNIYKGLKDWVLGLFGIQGANMREASQTEKDYVKMGARDTNKIVMESLRKEQMKAENRGDQKAADDYKLRYDTLIATIEGNKTLAGIKTAVENPKETVVPISIPAQDNWQMIPTASEVDQRERTRH